MTLRAVTLRQLVTGKERGRGKREREKIIRGREARVRRRNEKKGGEGGKKDG